MIVDLKPKISFSYICRKNLPERLLRERAVFKVHSDFVSAATRGAIAVIDGNVMAINPGEDPKMQMFIWNNIFFSLGFDVRDHYKVKQALKLIPLGYFSSIFF